MKKRTGIILTSISGALCLLMGVGIIVGNSYANKYGNLITMYFNQSSYKIIDGEEGEKVTFDRKFHNENERIDYEKQICEEVLKEGIVLLENKNNALPIATSQANKAKVSMFGVCSRDFVYGGGGSGTVDPNTATTLKESLENANFEINDTLYKFYKEGAGKKYAHKYSTAAGGTYELNEVPRSLYGGETSAVRSSFTNYKDAAIVVIGRSGSESSDLPTQISAGRSYLVLSKEEEDLLSLIAESNFSRTILVINSPNAMELGFLNKDEYKIDAAIWVGNVGQTGVNAIGKVLSGEVNPSGRLVDTYAYNAFSAPSNINFGLASIKNDRVSVKNASQYVVYQEGIYVGYKYYETRYEDVVLNSGNATATKGSTDGTSWNYTKEVLYPFGYGLSYTNFEYRDYQVNEVSGGYEVSVTVNNSGNAAGKEVVQVYLQSPYTEYDRQNHIEKSALDLVGFAKTKAIPAHGNATVKIFIDKENFKVYDAENKKTYIVEGSDQYRLALGKNAHDALNNILADKGKTIANNMDSDGNSALVKKLSVSEDLVTYAVSQVNNDYHITNQFADADIRYYDPDFKYLSRSDWDNTYPTAYQNKSWNAPDQVLEDAKPQFTSSDDSVQMPPYGVNNGLNIVMMKDIEFDNPLWDKLVQQLSLAELVKLIKDAGYCIPTIESVALPFSRNLDGPAGLLSVGGVYIPFDEKTFSWACEVNMSSTWNLELIEEVGSLIGEDALANSEGNQKISGWYAPGMNTHRSPFSGRNFEYYSEDPFLGYKMSGAQIKGATEKGLICFMKHFALNDQEAGRTGLLVFANEQSIRQTYLSPFEGGVREGGALGTMVSMNRIGARWSGGHKGLVTETLKKEWGFKGAVVTDQASFPSFYYEDIREGLENGTTMWLNTDSTLWAGKDQLSGYDSNPLLVKQMQEAAKYNLYAASRSIALKDLSSSSRVVDITPPWRIALTTVEIVGESAFVIFFGFSLTMLILAIVKGKNNKVKKQ